VKHSGMSNHFVRALLFHSDDGQEVGILLPAPAPARYTSPLGREYQLLRIENECAVYEEVLPT
jgi:hypothetical protein